MSWSVRQPGREMLAATVGAGLIGAQYIAGKAARDALFLTAFDPSWLPRMIIATSIFSIVLVIASSKFLSRVSPGRWVPIAFAANAILFGIEWSSSRGAGAGAAATLLYLQVSGLGPMLGSGFWLIASEQFDPRTAKKNFGTIAGAGTLGGLLGGLIAARITAATSIEMLLPVLAAANAICAWQVWQMARGHTVATHVIDRRAAETTDTSSGLRLIAATPYLQNLALLVLLGTVAAVMVDYVFKVQVKSTFGGGPSLGSFFSVYYAVISLLTFGVQTLASKMALQRFGLAACASSPALTLAAGGAVSLVTPGLPPLVLTRAAEAITRGSLYRAGYELFYTPMAPKEKRSVKAVVDVGVDRSGDIVGATIVQLLLLLPVSQQPIAMTGLAIICSVAALTTARRLTPGYVQTLEQSLRNRAADIDLSDVQDRVTRTVVLKTMRATAAQLSSADATAGSDQEVQKIISLRTADDRQVSHLLRLETDLSAALVPHVIPLLARDHVAADAVRALQTAADSHTGALIDALVNPAQPFVVRRRLPRVLAACTSQRAVDGLLLGLDDLRFEVRFRCGRALNAILRQNPTLCVDEQRILPIVRKEVAVSRPVWEGRQLLDGASDGAEGPNEAESLISARANKSLAHVFSLLSLILPAEPLHIAYHGLHTSDQGLRGTALEYIDAVLPAEIRDSLWPFLEDQRDRPKQVRTREEIAAELLAAHQSIQLNLAPLKGAPTTIKL